MADLRVICLSSRTASLLLCPDGARYHLPAPIRWSLWANGAQLRQGVAEIAPLFFEDLTPDRVYRLESDLGAIEFRTKPCAGLIEAVEFGASPKAADNAPALAKAIAATPQGGCLRLSPGCYASAPLFLKPGITLWLPKGAVIEALADWRADWPVLPAFDPAGRYTGSWEGLPEACFAAPITAIDCPGLILTGLGCIDGGGDRGDWWSWPKETRQGARRPRTIYIVRSRDVQLSGLTIRNSPSWTIHPLLCDGLIASALHIENPPDSPNTDGFNPESCCDLEMTGLRFSVGDDCIAVKSGKRAPGQESHLAPTRRLSISHCHMERGHGAVVLGSEMSGEITDVTIARCRFDGTDRGLRLKTRRGRGGAIARVVMEEVEMKNVATPFAANAFYYCDPDGHSAQVQSRDPAPVDHRTPRIEDITLRNVTAHNAQIAGAALLGLPEAPLQKIRFSNFQVSFDPNAEAASPLMADAVPLMRHMTIYSQFAETLGNVQSLPCRKEPQPC